MFLFVNELKYEQIGEILAGERTGLLERYAERYRGDKDDGLNVGVKQAATHCVVLVGGCLLPCVVVEGCELTLFSFEYSRPLSASQIFNSQKASFDGSVHVMGSYFTIKRNNTG